LSKLDRGYEDFLEGRIRRILDDEEQVVRIFYLEINGVGGGTGGR